jgi:hypothetical protein
LLIGLLLLVSVSLVRWLGRRCGALSGGYGEAVGNDAHHEQVLLAGLGGVERELVLQHLPFGAVHQVGLEIMPLSDRAGELRTGHGRTGSGRRQGHTFAAASRMRNTFIAAGPHTPEQLIGSVDKGLYCKSMGGGSVGPTGQFNFAVEEGYLIENGQLTKPVKGATLIGEAKEVMPRISMCANDLELAAGFCGSVSGSIFVTVGQPHIKVDSITVGGR